MPNGFDDDPYLVPKKRPSDPNRAALGDPRVRTFLDQIGKAEGADYNTLVGGRKIKDLSRHPNIVGLRTPAGPSTAFGKYQIVRTTDRSKLRKYANLDYSPENQDLRAVELLRQTGALEALQSDDVDTAIKRAGREWASLPGSPLPGRKNPAAFAQQDPYLVPKGEPSEDPYLVAKPEATPEAAPTPRPSRPARPLAPTTLAPAFRPKPPTTLAPAFGQREPQAPDGQLGRVPDIREILTEARATPPKTFTEDRAERERELRIRDEIRAQVISSHGGRENVNRVKRERQMVGQDALTIDRTIEEQVNTRLADFKAREQKVAQAEKSPTPLGILDKIRELGDHPAQLLPFIGSAADIAELVKLGSAAKKLEMGNATEEDMLLLREFHQKGQQDSTFWYKVADTVSMLPGFVGEFAATSGIYSAVKQGTLQSIKRLATKRGLQKLERSLAGRVGAKAVGSLAGAAAQTIPAGATRIPAGVLWRQQEGDDFGKALAKTMGDQFIEIASERTGAALKFIPVPQRLTAIRDAITARWLGKAPGRTMDQLEKVIERVGWHGVLGEIFEERVGDVARYGVGLQESAIPSLEQLAIEGIAFSVPGAANIGARAVLSRGGQREAQPQLIRPEAEGTPAQGLPAEPPAVVSDLGVPPVPEVVEEAERRQVRREFDQIRTQEAPTAEAAPTEQAAEKAAIEGEALPPSPPSPAIEAAPAETELQQKSRIAAEQVAAIRPEVQKAVDDYLEEIGKDITDVTSDADTRQHRDFTGETAGEIEALLAERGITVTQTEVEDALYALRHEELPEEIELPRAPAETPSERRATPRTEEGDLDWATNLAETHGGTLTKEGNKYVVSIEGTTLERDSVSGAVEAVKQLDSRIRLLGSTARKEVVQSVEREGAEPAEPSAPKPRRPTIPLDQLTNVELRQRVKRGGRRVQEYRQELNRREDTRSLSASVRAQGGIKSRMFRGELSRLGLKEAGTTGILNQKSGKPAEWAMQAANEEGYRDLDGKEFEHIDAFIDAIESDLVPGVRRRYIKLSEGSEQVDFDAAEREYYETQQQERDADARVALLENEQTGVLYDRIAEGSATDADIKQFKELAEKTGLSAQGTEDLIASARPVSEQEAAPVLREKGRAKKAVKAPRLVEAARKRKAKRAADKAEGIEYRHAGVDPQILIDDIIVYGYDLYSGTVKPTFQDWAQKVRERFGSEAEPHLAKVWTDLGGWPLTRAERFGPGAASTQEPIPQVKERKFGKRFVEDERIAQEIRDTIGTAKYYEPIPNKVTAAEAKKLVDERGVAESIQIVKDENNTLPFHVRVAMGQIVQLRANQAFRNLKDSNPADAQLILEQSNETAEFLMEYGTRLGQGVQSYAMWARQTPEGILLSYQKGINKARAEHKKAHADEVSEIIDTANKQMTDEERIKELKKLFKTNKTARKIKSDWQKIVDAAKDGKLNDSLFYDIVGDKLGLPTATPEVVGRIADLAEKIEAAPEGLPRDRLVLELNKYIAEQKGFGPADLPIGMFYAHILSGYNTHIVNMMDTTMNVISEINGLAMNNPRAAARIYGGALRGLANGRMDFLLALTEGRMVTDGKWMEVPRLMEVAKFGKKGGVPIQTGTRAGRAAKRIAESKIAVPLNAYKFVTRMLAASDAVMFRTTKEARASLLAYRMAQAEGLRGDALQGRVNEILGLDRRADFVRQAEREGFTGVDAKVRAAELMDLTRDPDISSDAAEFAGEATYNHTPHGLLGFLADSVSKTSEAFKPLKLFVPFTRIVANVTNRGLNYTPYGYKRAFMGHTFGGQLAPEQRRLMLTRATVGTTGLVLLASLQQAGLLAIHGNGPDDREKRRQLMNAGWRPYSLQIGDTYIRYVDSPLGLGLSVVGNWSDSQRYHTLEERDSVTRLAYAVVRVGSTVFSQSFLSGLSRLFGALSDEPGRSVASVRQTVSSTASAATTPNLVRDLHRLFDNKAYESNTLMEDLIRNTPFAGLSLKPALNAFGEPVRLPRQRWLGTISSDSAWQFVVKQGLRVPVPGRTTEIEKGTRITPEQYYKLLQTTGPQVRQWILDNRDDLKEMKEQDAQDELSKAATAIRKVELDRMRGIPQRPQRPSRPRRPQRAGRQIQRPPTVSAAP